MKKKNLTSGRNENLVSTRSQKHAGYNDLKLVLEEFKILKSPYVSDLIIQISHLLL